MYDRYMLEIEIGGDKMIFRKEANDALCAVFYSLN